MTRNQMIAPCGIDCSECEIYKAANNPKLAEETAKRWRESWAPEAAPSWFVCQGCRVDRSLVWCGDCKIYACYVEERGLENCSVCRDFPCDKLKEWSTSAPHHTTAFERLKKMRAEGE